MLVCIKCRPNMSESEMVTSKFVFYIKFPKFWYITLMVTKFSTIFLNSGVISWTTNVARIGKQRKVEEFHIETRMIYEKLKLKRLEN